MKLDPWLLLSAYSEGIFPMAQEDGQLFWYDPDPRAIIPLDGFHVPRRLARTVRQAPYEIRFNTAYRRVMEFCAMPGRGRQQTWISSQLTEAYVQLHRLGFAHSVEAWRDGNLVGGLYGVAIHSFFAGESMFSLQRDASKVALVHLVRRLQRRRFTLLDTQFITGHLAQFGAVEISRAQYRTKLAAALGQNNHF